MDVLSDVLRAVRLTGAVFFDVDFSAPWVAETPPGTAIAANVMPEAEHIIMFHAITSGDGWAELLDDSVPPFRLSAGDIIVLPMSDAHVLCSRPGMRATPDLAMYRRPNDRHLPIYVEKGDGGGEQTRFVCGYLGCDARPFNPVLQALPRLLHTRGVDGVGSITELFRLAIQETATRRPGSETVLSKVAELMFVDVVRRYIDTLPKDATGWLSGLRDAHVGKALALMHARPAEAWTLERLAREVGVSRSVFAERFVHYVREPPMHYLARWRMQLATRLLERQGIGIAQVAEEVGYESEAAFNRAFKKVVGVPPGAWRRDRRASLEIVPPA
jgi:AraC-like DNA-binding protein